MDCDKKFLKSKFDGALQIKKIQGEASNRSFYRILFKDYTLVAMVYPTKNSSEIKNIIKLTDLYNKNQINVPQIKDIINNRVIIQEDLGDILVQQLFSKADIKKKRNIISKVSDILIRLKSFPITDTNNQLNINRMKWEMDFFLNHFAKNFLSASKLPSGIQELKVKLHQMVEQINPIDTFAHRDFHSRNMLFYKNSIFLVDFQDSLQAPPWYDLVSFAFDCYLDLKSHRKYLLGYLNANGLPVDDEQFYLTALQRNIKALGTFGFQVVIKKNLIYKKYIPRTLRHIKGNPMMGRFFQPSDFELLPMLKNL